MKNIKITDEHWKLFSQYLIRNNKSKADRPQSIDDRLAFEGILYVLKTGIPWRYLPKEYGAWQTVYKLFARWAKSGTLEKLLQTFREHADKVHKHGSAPRGGQKKTKHRTSRGGITNKIHAVTDALGYPLKIMLSGGNVHDVSLAKELLSDMQAKAVLADKAYNSRNLIALIEEKCSEAVIRPKKNAKVPRSYDKHLYKERHVIECFFSKNKRKPQNCYPL